MSDQRDPSWSPDVRARVHDAVNRVLFAAQELQRRYDYEISGSELWQNPEAYRPISALAMAVRDVLYRRADEDGMYIEPGEVAGFGDVTGVLGAVNHQVVQRLQAAIDAVESVPDAHEFTLGRMRAVGDLKSALVALKADFAQIYTEIDDYKRALYGPGYKPVGRNF